MHISFLPASNPTNLQGVDEVLVLFIRHILKGVLIDDVVDSSLLAFRGLSLCSRSIRPHLGPFGRILQGVIDVSAGLTHGGPALVVSLVEEDQVQGL